MGGRRPGSSPRSHRADLGDVRPSRARISAVPWTRTDQGREPTAAGSRPRTPGRGVRPRQSSRGEHAVTAQEHAARSPHRPSGSEGGVAGWSGRWLGSVPERATATRVEVSLSTNSTAVRSGMVEERRSRRRRRVALADVTLNRQCAPTPTTTSTKTSGSRTCADLEQSLMPASRTGGAGRDRLRGIPPDELLRPRCRRTRKLATVSALNADSRPNSAVVAPSAAQSLRRPGPVTR